MEPSFEPRPPSAREQEREAALARRLVPARPLERTELGRMLVRRGFRPHPTLPALPFDPGRDLVRDEELARFLDHYSGRLFLRGAILRPDGFRAEEATRYVDAARCLHLARALEELGILAEHGGVWRLVQPVPSFGPLLEWYVARALEDRLGFETALGVRWGAPDVGGDLDVVAAAEGRLVYLELKSSPPKHLAANEVRAFLERVRALRPEIALFVMDTALRLSDKVLPLFAEEAARVRPLPAPERVVREVWALTPHLYLVNARHDLLANLERAVAEGFRALGPAPP